MDSVTLTLLLVSAALAASLIATLSLWWRQRAEIARLRETYGQLDDVHAEERRVEQATAGARAELDAFLAEASRRRSDVEGDLALHKAKVDDELAAHEARASERRVKLERDIQVELDAFLAEASQRRSDIEGDLASHKAKVDDELSAHEARASERRVKLERDIQAELSVAKSELDAFLAEASKRRSDIEARFQAALDQLAHLSEEVRLYEAQSDLQSFGLYEPYYDFDTSERFKQALDAVRAQQKEALKAKTAAVCPVSWTVEGSQAKGRQMINRILKLMLRAFNGECDAAIAKVRFNNATALIERIRRAHMAINKLGESNSCSITEGYLALKLAELQLTHEHAVKRQEEQEEQREIRAQLREEERAQREAEKAQCDAEKEEARQLKALEQARRELGLASEERRAAMAAKVTELEAELAIAHGRLERAVSQAQLTRSGHVYVISNIGSFGEDVYKIGMTRRLEPMDRVKELGDASVPFRFDVHAMIYSTDAPSLESALHKALDDRRLNLVNNRKEFFRVPLDEIEAVAQEQVPGELEFVRTALAEEYRESQAARRARAQAAKAPGPVEEGAADPVVLEEKARLSALQAMLADL